MARPDKAAAVEELKEAFSASNATVLTEYRGPTVKSIKALRRALGEDATYAVAKNTLTQIAVKEAGIEGLDEQLTLKTYGPSCSSTMRIPSSSLMSQFLDVAAQLRRSQPSCAG